NRMRGNAGYSAGIQACSSLPGNPQGRKARSSQVATAPLKQCPNVRRSGELNLYAHPFTYHRVKSLTEASNLLRELGEESRALAGGQSLIPLMKMRLARPTALIDINFIPGLSEIAEKNGELRIGALARHSELEASEEVAAIPILQDCAAGIADVQ